jgi:hypothetical protein
MGRTLTHSGEHGKLYLIRDLRPDGDNAFVGRLVVLRIPDSFCLFKDAGLWCAVPPRFQDFDEDPTGWGHTQEEAVQNLVGSARFRTKAAQEGWNNNPVATDFTVLDESAELPYGPDLLPEQKKGL